MEDLIMKPRNSIVYKLLKGNKIEYFGTTNNLERREKKHKSDGKQFDSIKPVSRLMTEEGAKKREKELLAKYRKTHKGKNPKYNKDSDG